MGAYPGDGKTVEYKEGIWVGYRWTEKEKIQPLFAFGHGVSYLPRPVKELKGFRKVWLTPGETCNVSFVVDKESLSYYDPVKHGWMAEPGKFQALVGSASDDIKAKVIFELK